MIEKETILPCPHDEPHQRQDTRRKRLKRRSRLTVSPLPADEKTISVPEAGRRYFGLGRNASYDAARRGEIPTIQIGRMLRSPIVALERMLERAGDKGKQDDAP
jgi:hypothetical protein